MIVAFSDLDGTLLDHETYSFVPARPALAALKARGIPLILASSKTEAEMRPIARSMGLDHPMIVENGAGIVGLPEESTPSGDGSMSPYNRLRMVLRQMPKELNACFEGFGDWDVARVAKETGLPLAAAQLACQRRFSEPGHFTGSDLQKRAFVDHLEQAGFTAVQGGRFFTLMPKTSKAARMAEVTDHYRRLSGEPIATVALGDAENDLAMLEAADRGFIIINPAHAPLAVTERERLGFITRSQTPGPQGWNECVLPLVETGF